MNMKLKALVAVTAMAIAAQANAAIDSSTTGNGELFLTVWDNAAKISYTRDLGTNLNDFLVAPASAAGLKIDGSLVTTGSTYAQYKTDANWTTFIGALGASGTSNLQWNIGAMDSTGITVGGGSRYLSTSNNTLAQVKGQSNSALNTFNISNNLVTGVNAFGTHQTSGLTGDGSAVNVGTDGSAYAETWYGNNWFNKAQGWTSSAAIGQDLNFFFLTTSSSAGLAKASVTQYGYTDANGVFKNATFTLAANGNLIYAVPPSVPVPAAVWLLGSALVGLVGVARRKTSVA